MAALKKPDQKGAGKGGAATAVPPSLVDVFPLWELAAAEHRDAPGAPHVGVALLLIDRRRVLIGVHSCSC